MNVLAREIEQLQKNWDSAETDVECLRLSMTVICDLLTTDLEGHHTHAQRNGMVILIRQQAKAALRKTDNVKRRSPSVPVHAQGEVEDIPF